MSTLKTVNIQHPSSSTPAITLDSTGAMSGSFPYPNRNLLYNGAMQIAQRGTSTAGISGTGGYYTADRWQTTINNTIGTWTQTVENDAPTGSGFVKSLKMLVTAANASPAAAAFIRIDQPLEGQDLQRIAKGTASAQQLTLSFWVKSNVTGTYTANLIDTDNARLVAATYSISASATWERKTITFPADTTGPFNNDNELSLRLVFNLAVGSDLTSDALQTIWGANVTANRAAGQVNVAANTNNYWQITGVQLETGSVATQFEFKPYAQELSNCMRYYWRSSGSSNWASYGVGRAQTSTVLNWTINMPYPMRRNPTSMEFLNLCAHQPGIAAYNFTAMSAAEGSIISCDGTGTVASGLVAGNYYHVSNNGNTNGYIAFSAEL